MHNFQHIEDLELHDTRTNSSAKLPRQLEPLTALRSLRIDCFNGIKSLPE